MQATAARYYDQMHAKNLATLEAHAASIKTAIAGLMAEISLAAVALSLHSCTR